MKTFEKNFSERGSSLISVIIAALIGLSVMMLIAYSLSGLIVSNVSQTESKEAETAAEEALSVLSANVRDLQDVAGFTDMTGKEHVLTLAQCSAQTCDQVLLPDAEAGDKNSPAGGYAYGMGAPPGKKAVLLRRWRIRTVNADYGLREITVAILSSETDTKPLIAITTVVGNIKQ